MNKRKPDHGKPLAPNEYRCAACGCVFEKGWTDEEAVAELNNNFPGFTTDECAVVCDDCHKQMVSE